MTVAERTSTCACAGTRHVFDSESGAWRACSCLERSRASGRWRAARLPERHDPETWHAFLARFEVVGGPEGLLAAGASLAKGGRDARALLWGDDEGRSLATTLLLKAALRATDDAELLELPRLIDHEFRREDVPGRPGNPYLRRVIAVRLGEEPRHAYNPKVLEKLLRVRWEAALPTVACSAGEPSGLGALYRSPAVEEAVSRFEWFEVVGK